MDTIYICPMHSEIRKQGAGECPLCGMALEPEIISEETEGNPELTDFRKRLYIGAILTVPIVLLAMSEHFFDIEHFISHKTSAWIQLILALPAVLWVGYPFFVRGVTSFKNRALNMFSLIALGTGVALLYSIIATIAPGIFPVTFQSPNGSVPIYFEAAAVIVLLVLLGQILELKARERTGSAIKALLGLTPKTARLITKESNQQGAQNLDKEIPIADITVNDHLRIRPGEKIPVDGIVINGESYIDESMISGEPLAVAKQKGAKLIAGTLNKNGTLVMQATRVGSDTMLASIISLVAKASRSRAPIQSLADSVAAWFVPCVMLIALIAFVAWSFLASSQGAIFGLIAAVSVLIIACPCALGLATPMSIMVGIGKGARRGILIKDAASLETLEKITTLVIDKTGTLTTGHPTLTNCHTIKNTKENELIQLAASLEQNSEHPLASAIMDYARKKSIKLHTTKNFKAITGKGISAKINGKRVLLGNASLMQEAKISIESLKQSAAKAHSEGETVMFLAANNAALGFIAVSDPIKESTPKALEAIRAKGINIIMLSGDNKTTVASVATKLGIQEFFGEVMPQDKHRLVEQYRRGGAIVAMAGDGINDAPALAEADVGIAMGSGTDVAIESAGITLVKGDLQRLVEAIDLSRLVIRNIKQNLFLAFVYNAIGVPIAAGILYPAFGILLPPIFAAAAMSLSSVSVITNALRLNWTR